ncbi:MAG: DNA methyltransferase [Candidatus Bathyarchaeia archaeon]
MSLKPYRSMEPFTEQDYKAFVAKTRHVMIDGVPIKLAEPQSTRAFGPPSDYRLEDSTVWSFPNRGDWATHTGEYRGNWSPYIPRNLILRYTKPGELVLDQMMGSGTTLVECKLLSRESVGVDINPAAVVLARDRLNFSLPPRGAGDATPTCEVKTYIGDARNLDLVRDDSVDLVATHPPYAGIVAYSRGAVEGDLSDLSIDEYVKEMRVVAEEAYRVLKPGRRCAILIGDTRRRLHYVPISVRVMEAFLDVGFALKEDIVKLQWHMKTTRERWRGRVYDFYKIAHEHLYIFTKTSSKTEASNLKYSLKWWP